MVCKEIAETCLEDNECTSNHCKASPDGSLQICAGEADCVVGSAYSNVWVDEGGSIYT
jgi:hypothetical protein